MICDYLLLLIIDVHVHNVVVIIIIVEFLETIDPRIVLFLIEVGFG